MTSPQAARCHRCTRPNHEGTGWQKKEHYRDGTIYLHDACPEKVCLKFVAVSSRSVQSYVCGRDGKEQTSEGWLCGRHLDGYRRREQSVQQMHQITDASDANDANLHRAKPAIDVLADLGIAATPNYDNVRCRYDGGIVVDPQDLFRLIGVAISLPNPKS